MPEISQCWRHREASVSVEGFLGNSEDKRMRRRVTDRRVVDICRFGQAVRTQILPRTPGSDLDFCVVSLIEGKNQDLTRPFQTRISPFPITDVSPTKRW